MANKPRNQVIPMYPIVTSKNSLPLNNGNGNAAFSKAPSTFPRNSMIGAPDLSDVKKALMTHNGGQYQMIPVEIEKDQELGLVIGQVEGDSLIFIDEILPNGMIDMHGILKEGDYLLQAGSYDLREIDVSSALILIERAFDEGRKSISFVAARQEKDAKAKQAPVRPVIPVEPVKQTDRPASRAQSFVDYEEPVDDTHF